MKFTQILPVSCLATLALSATVDVTVGPGLVYSPDTVTAAKGDVIRFKFGAGHNVVSGKFNSPCQPDGMIYSGNPKNGDTFSVTLNSTDPVWIYCSVPGHCEGGMAMVINAPSGSNITAYKKAASTASSSNSPNSVAGGVLNAQAASSSSSSSSSMSMSTAMSSSGSMTATMTSGSSMSTSAASSAAASSTTRSAAAGALASSGSTVGMTLVALAVALGSTMRIW